MLNRKFSNFNSRTNHSRDVTYNLKKMNKSEKNTLKNEKHYDKVYNKINIQSILNIIENLKVFMADATQTDTSWVGLYQGDFQNQLKNKKVLELGCGDCTNAAVMAAFGAEVYANDISQKSG